MAAHPLEPLGADEFRLAARVLRSEQDLSDSWRFASIELKEPPKAEVKAWRPGDAVPRTAFAVLWNRADNQTWEGVVDLTGDRVVSWTHVPGVTPNFTVDEYHEVDEAMRAHPDVIAALAEARHHRHVAGDDRGVDLRQGADAGEVRATGGWAGATSGTARPPRATRTRHPVSGLKVVVDVNTLELLEIENDHDHGQPDVDAEYVPGAVERGAAHGPQAAAHHPARRASRFTVEGTELKWQNWSMRLGFNYREGPVIYQVTYDDHGTVRDIAYRMSFAEMVVPYRDASFDHYRRTAFDIGEWGLGFMTTSLELGCDCLGEIVYLDAVLHDTAGEPYTIKNAICLHEEDNAVLWKHVDHTLGAEVRRMRRLVVSCHVTVANYEYLVYWRFYQDGNIECEVRATGLMVTTPFDDGG